MTQMPVHLPNHNFWANLSIVAMFGLGIATLFFDTAVVPLSVLVLILSNIYGVLFAIRVGGADMPITISLLNSFSGLAGSIVGFTISDPLLIALGAIVGGIRAYPHPDNVQGNEQVARPRAQRRHR